MHWIDIVADVDQVSDMVNLAHFGSIWHRSMKFHCILYQGDMAEKRIITFKKPSKKPTMSSKNDVNKNKKTENTIQHFFPNVPSWGILIVPGHNKKGHICSRNHKFAF